MLIPLLAIMLVSRVAPVIPINSVQVTVTAYTSSVQETDSDPWTAAWGNKLRPGDRVVAVSRDLERLGLVNGTVVYVEGLGFFTVKDRMHWRKKRWIDIWFETDRRKALRFGKKKLTVYWISTVREEPCFCGTN